MQTTIPPRRGGSSSECRSTTHSGITCHSCSTSGSTTQPTNHSAVSSSVHAGVKVLAVIIGLTAALAVVGAAPATTPVPGQVGALKAIRVALAAGRIDGATANAGRAEIARAAHLVRTLPSGRREHVAVALEELAAFSGRLTAPRALALIGQLEANDDYFAKHYAPGPKTDITDADGLVYRYFPGRCLEFHPLANFGALNAHVAANDAAGAQRLADALIARGVYQQGGGIAWEYFFDYSGGRAPWLSGMAQAVAAQAFARTAALVPDQETALMREARAAYRAIPSHLLTSVAAGPWIRLYSFQSLRVLNAQLQAVISLESYADDCRGSRRGGARRTHAACRGSDAPELRHGLLDLLFAPARSVSSRLSAVRRPVAQEARAERPALRRRCDAIRGLSTSAARVPAHERIARSAALLAVETGDGAGEHRGRPDQAARARRRLAHARLARAETPRHLPRPRHRRRLGREPCIVRRAADRARDRGRKRVRRAHEGGLDEGRRRDVSRRRGARRSGPGRDAAEARPAARTDRCHLAGGRHRTRPELSSLPCSACPPGSGACSN